MTWKNIALLLWNVNVNTKSDGIDLDRAFLFSHNTQICRE